jgi:type IX secretion system PorP/SprF family membrane protein
MKKPECLLIIFFIIMPGLKSMSQSDISMATHWYNRANYNPAFITRTDYLYLFANARQQWMGISGAPQVFNVQASEYISNLHSAFGFSFVADKIGVTQAYNPMFSYAFRLSNDQKWSLSMGLSIGMFTRIIDGSSFEADDNNDKQIVYARQQLEKPDANIGLEFRSNHFILGASSTHLFSVFNQDETLLNSNHRYGYLIYKSSDPQLFNYNVGIQIVNRQNLTVLEGNVRIRFKHPTGLLQGPSENFEFGLTVRSTRQITFLFGMNVLSNMRIGYAYDQSFMSGFNLNGTHEIMMEYRIFTRAASSRFVCGKDTFWYH